MSGFLKRSFVGAGLVILVMPGAFAEHLWSPWAFVGLGFLAGLIAGMVVRDG